MSVELKNWKELCKEKDERIKELEGKFDLIVERLEEELQRAYDECFDYPHILEEVINKIKEVGGMND